MTSQPSVVVSGICKSFGTVVALRDVSLTIDRGEVVGLLGPNGAGKTTMVDILATLTRPDRGSAVIAGYDVHTAPAQVRGSIMLTGQHVAVDNMLTGRQNLVMFARLQGLSKPAAQARATELIGEFDLAEAAHRRVSTYSGGMRRRIDIACGLVVFPQVAFLDEPTTGLDPRSRRNLWNLIARLKNAGIAVLLTTQYLEEADALSDRIIVIDRGTIIAEGTSDELKAIAGGTVCEIVPLNPGDRAATMEALGPLLPKRDAAALGSDSGPIAVPAPNGAHTLVEAVRRLDSANLQVADVALRRPSLDDVFFSLTGEFTTDSAAQDVMQ